MKAYTDLDQSKKLAEILPFESADIILTLEGNSELTSYPIMRNYSEFYNYLRIFELEEKYIKHTYIPAWSLAALINMLPKEINVLGTIYSIDIHTKNEKWFIDYKYNNEQFVGVYSNIFVDACVEMIKKLHELKLL